MANKEYTFYCVVSKDYPQLDISAGTYRFTSNSTYHRNTKMVMASDRVWRVGPKGGVKITKNHYWAGGGSPYVTKDEEKMKQFMWVKLQAQDNKKGA